MSNFHNIGNRMTAEELADEIAYSANNLNQYTAIEKNSGTPFVPTFDDDGNQLTVQTATGVWNVIYNAENRPITFTQGTTVIECKYDSQGRRFEKKVIANNVVTFWQRYAYKGYLQIAAFNVSIVDESETLTLVTTTFWDPTEPTATRPLAFTDHTVATPTTYFYTHDLTKNVCEILSRNGTAVSIATTYDYTPFGAVTASNSSTPNTFCFSSEVLDPETNLVYYNYRHYNPTDGRWINRDPIEEQGGWNLYIYSPFSIDELGCASIKDFVNKLIMQGRFGTYELDVPLGASGVDLVFTIKISETDNTCCWDVSLSGGVSFSIKGKILKLVKSIPYAGKWLTEKMSVLPDVSLQIYLGLSGKICCDCWDFGSGSINGQLTLGNGANGGNQKSGFGYGVWGTLQGAWDTNKGIISASGSISWALNMSFRWLSYNADGVLVSGTLIGANNDNSAFLTFGGPYDVLKIGDLSCA